MDSGELIQALWGLEPDYKLPAKTRRLRWRWAAEQFRPHSQLESIKIAETSCRQNKLGEYEAVHVLRPSETC